MVEKDEDIANDSPANAIKTSQDGLRELTLLRCFAVLSLVVHHVLCIYLSEPWGGVESPLNEYFSKLLRWFVPDANMPLFVIIAGYLMKYQLIGNKYKDGRIFLRKKAHRLLMPYLVLGSILLLLQPGLNDWKDMLYGMPNQMWFCLMLFYCYILFYALETKSPQWVSAIFASASLFLNMQYGNMGIVCDKLHLIGGMEIALYYYFYFWLGARVFDNWKSLYTLPSAMIILTVYCFANTLIKPVFKTVAYIVLLMIIAYWFARNVNWPEWVNKVVDRVAKCSFGVYVFHHLILWDATHIDIFSQYTLPFFETHYIMAPIVAVVSTFVVSMLLTDMLLKTKIGRYLLS